MGQLALEVPSAVGAGAPISVYEDAIGICAKAKPRKLRHANCPKLNPQPSGVLDALGDSFFLFFSQRELEFRVR
jgi:hypothetical protein